MQLRLVVVGVAVALVTACGSSPTSPGGTAALYQATSFVAGVQSDDGRAATFNSGTSPAAASGPTMTITGNASVINGGSNLVHLKATAGVSSVIVSVVDVSGGVGGYWDLPLSSATTDLYIVVVFGRSLPAGSFTCRFAGRSSSGTVGAYVTLPQTVVAAAQTGDVQVSASWDALSDVDLHVIEPGGFEIYYGDNTSSTQGALDLDSNPACRIDGVNNENIRWPSGRAPAGTYTVRLDYYNSCAVGTTRYVVTVNNGGTSSIFRGTFTGTGDRGGRGAGTTITTFQRASSLSPSSVPARVRDLGAQLIQLPPGAVGSPKGSR